MRANKLKAQADSAFENATEKVSDLEGQLRALSEENKVLSIDSIELAKIYLAQQRAVQADKHKTKLAVDQLQSELANTATQKKQKLQLVEKFQEKKQREFDIYYYRKLSQSLEELWLQRRRTDNE